MRILALDIGTKRTGVAYADTDTGIPLPLDTIHHQTIDDLVAHVKNIMHERAIDHVVIGLPLLPSGDEGSQVKFVRSVASKITKSTIDLTFIDERYSTPSKRKEMPVSSRGVDPDAAAACAILQQFLMFDKNSGT